MEKMYQQLGIDFKCSLDEVRSAENIFTTGMPQSEMRFLAQGNGDIVCINNKILCRTDNFALTARLQETFSKGHGEWFFENQILRQFEGILNEFDYEIKNTVPFFVPQSSQRQEVDQTNLVYYTASDILQFKGDQRFNEAFIFDETYPDQLGIAYVEAGEIIAMVGANQNGKYLWEVGIEIIGNHQKRGIATMLLKEITNQIFDLTQESIVPVYGTQFSHTKSMNVAIRAGYKVGWTEIVFGKK